MAFNDLPIVDDNSMNSEESVRAVQGFFSQKNGFISRIETPDFGCDIDVELIIAGNASSKKFPIQVKSELSVSVVTKDSNELISKSFKTSRLNYLCNRPPAYGLVIIYDDTTQICYYDFVEKIIARIKDEKNTDDWKAQASVNIHLPKQNILAPDIAKTIHEIFDTRFRAHDLLINRHGQEFEIPSFAFNENETPIDKFSTVELIKKYGLFFINSYDIALVHNMLAEVTFQEIINSPQLILIASIVYSEIGKVIEAEFYLNKATQFLQFYDESEKEIIKFTQIKVDFLLGKRLPEDYFNDLKNLTEITKNKFNEVQININLLYYSILDQVKKNQFDESIEISIMDTFKAIEDLDLDESKKHLFNIYHAGNLHMYISSWMLKKILNIRLRDSLMVQIDHQERLVALNKANEYIKMSLEFIFKAWEFGKTKSNKLVEAHALFSMSYFFFIRHYNFLLLTFKEDQPELQVLFKRAFLQSVKSHNLFLELGHLKDARLSLINAYELNRLSKLYYNIDVTTELTTEEILLNNLHASEHAMGLNTTYQPIVDTAFARYNQIMNVDNDDNWAQMTDDQIEQYASIILGTYGLPGDRLIHIINEMKILRYFNLNCDRENFLICFNLAHTRSNQTKYASPSTFILVNKVTGIESLPSTDVKSLAESFGALKK